MAVVNSKQQLRDEVARKIQEIAPEHRIVLDAQIATHVTHTPFWSSSDMVMGYMAMDDEVDLQAVFRTAHREGKSIALPRVEAKGEVMEFRWVQQYPASLERHPRGFLQPSADAPVVKPPPDALVLVPGCVFDRGGYRVGRGAGFYDRYLSQVSPEVVTVGIGYAVQLVQAVPRDRFDVPVQIVVTDSESCFCRRPKKTN